MRAVTFLACVALAGCAQESRQSLTVPAWAESLDEASFVAADEVGITLEEAYVLLSDLRLESPSATARRWRPRLIASAWAHPGHDFSGDTSCELLGDFVVDLLADPVDLGEAACLDGALATGRVWLTGEPALSLAGTAILPDATERAFRFELDLDEEVTGIEIETALDAGAPPASLTLGISPASMLSWVDWSSEDSDGDDLLTTADDLLGNTVPFGAVSTASFTLEIAE
jgi:hypothetical protein